ncbi:hypothetical protein [Actinophytocola algeriensis]|uniref:Lipoprotein n=1 Tax=Actinophytocola algeriensis TaxID=1768010 RepID=A0A7W7Q0G8_9PSEU|nr:hypothetical protein [Actinophytocola algeriensis]MBB4904563.1 hypothetical protein [Actinophytocola algeriensis]MBE1476578.1 hypothetical protein [Actinophytocola algeriensis]
MPVVVAAVLPVSACSSSAARCEEAFTAVTTSVSGVASAEFDCSDQFGGGWQRGHVVVEASTEDEAIAVVDAILRAYAASPDLEDRWATPQKYLNEDGSIIVSAGDVGFPAVPNVDEVREHYGITPG